ncbi:hypothetical protein QQ045_019711 [Rhodiola kirilowii]
MRVLSLSYTDLPYHLKPCYLYLNIFPEDHLIQKSRLIRLWIAEGFVRTKYNMTHEEVAESYLKEFVQRSLIQVADTLNEGIIETYCIHDLLRDVIYERRINKTLQQLSGERMGFGLNRYDAFRCIGICLYYMKGRPCEKFDPYSCLGSRNH